MPLYEFECQSCGIIDEQIVKSDIKEVECSKCKGRALKIISLSAFKLKGDHWSGGGSDPKWDNIKPGDSNFK